MKKTLLAVSILFITQAWAQKTPMPPQDRARLERLLEQEAPARDWPVAGELREYLEVGSTTPIFLPDPPRLPSRSRRNYDLESSTVRHLNRMLGRHHLGTGWSEEQLLKLAPYLGIRLAPSFKELSASVRVDSLNQVVDTYTKLPWRLIRTLRDRNRGIDLVGGNITNHPRSRFIANSRPRGWTNVGIAGTRTVETLPGGGAVGDLPTIIAADKLNDRSEATGHGCDDLVLHEVGHSVDRFYRNGAENLDYSPSRDFARIVEGIDYSLLYDVESIPYHRDYQEENFAELFSRYYLSSMTRNTLEWQVPGISTYFERVFGSR
jgi:hypothetical protein